MSVVAKGRPSTTVIDLDGSQGNAFVLLGYANDTMKKSGFDKEMKDRIKRLEYWIVGGMGAVLIILLSDIT